MQSFPKFQKLVDIPFLPTLFPTPSYIMLNLETKAQCLTISVFAQFEIRRLVLSNIQMPHCKTSE